MIDRYLQTTVIDILLRYIPSSTIIYIFGSMASNDETIHSDIDIAFLSTQEIDTITRYNISQTLSLELKKDIDLIDMKKSTDIINMQIVSKGICIFNKDDTNFEDNIYYKYIDLCELRSGIIEDIKKSGKIYG
jgi:predicted nucleotidyltransferase